MPENAPGLKSSGDAASAAILVITGTRRGQILQAFPISVVFFFFPERRRRDIKEDGITRAKIESGFGESEGNKKGHPICYDECGSTTREEWGGAEKR